MTYLILAVILLAAYYGLITWQVFGRGEFQFVYNGFMAWVLVNFMGRMQCITLGSRAYGYAIGWQIQLTPERRKHEEFHWAQQKRHPYTFFPRYLWLLIRWGYSKHPDEQEARAFAGEPLR